MLVRLIAAIGTDALNTRVVSLKSGGRFLADLRDLGVPVTQLGFDLGLGQAMIRTLCYAGSLIVSPPSVLQTWLYHADLVGTLLWLATLGRLRGTRLLWNLRCSEVDFGNYARTTRWVVAALARLSRFPETILFNSHRGQQDHARLGYRPRSWAYLPNGFDLNQFRPDAHARDAIRSELGVSADTPLVVMAARFDPMKDPETFLRAIRVFTSKYGAHARLSLTRFVLVGRGMEPSNPRLQQWMAELGVADRVLLLGSRADIARIFAAVDLLSTASIGGEGFPNVVGEALASGTPCVVTDSGDSRQVLGDCGVVVPPKNPDALALAWGAILTLGDAERAVLAGKCRLRVERLFDIRETAERYVKICTEPLHVGAVPR